MAKETCAASFQGPQTGVHAERLDRKGRGSADPGMFSRSGQRDVPGSIVPSMTRTEQAIVRPPRLCNKAIDTALGVLRLPVSTPVVPPSAPRSSWPAAASAPGSRFADPALCPHDPAPPADGPDNHQTLALPHRPPPHTSKRDHNS